MTFLQDLARALLQSGTPVRYPDTEDDRTNKEQFLVGDGQEVEIEYFDGEPQQFRWGTWRANKNGTPF
jgi:hypothetical protein